MDVFKNFQQTGNVKDEHAGNVGRTHAATTEGNAQLVQQAIQQWPQISIRRVAATVQIKPTLTHRLMRQNLRSIHTKFKLGNSLIAASIITREIFANDMVQVIDDGDLHVSSICFTHETCFNLDGFVNGKLSSIELPHIRNRKPPYYSPIFSAS